LPCFRRIDRLRQPGQLPSFLKKEAKNFYSRGPRRLQRARKRPEVFWFFFSKKNILIPTFLGFDRWPSASGARRVSWWVAQELTHPTAAGFCGIVGTNEG
jgi:hypothetical protein